MTREAFDALLIEAVPDFRDALHFERVDYYAGERRAVFSFVADRLVEDEAFRRIRQAIGKAFPRLSFSLRVASPSLADDFLTRPEQYARTVKGILVRNFPSFQSWADRVGWAGENGTLAVEFPDRFSLDYAREQRFSDRLSEILKDLFRIQPPLVLRLREDPSGEASPILPAEPTPPPAPPPRRTNVRKREQGFRIQGQAIAGKPVPISELGEASGRVIISGQAVSLERRDIPGRNLVLLSVLLTDHTGSIGCKAYLRPPGERRSDSGEPEGTAVRQREKKRLDELLGKISPGIGLKVRGDCQTDPRSQELFLSVKDMTAFEWPLREDGAPEKRVELHAHTRMSAMDGVAPARALIERAARWGHPAIAITDAGVVQAFPEAFAAARDFGIRLIPGMEANMIDRGEAVTDPDDRLLSEPLVVLDFETTGLAPRRDRIIEIGAVRLEGGEVTDRLSILVNPGVPLSEKVQRITGLCDADLLNQPEITAVLPQLLDFIGDSALAAHNADFDRAFLEGELARAGLNLKRPWVDTLHLAQKLFPDMRQYKLSALCKRLGVPLKNAHRAVHDAAATALCLASMLETLSRDGVRTLGDIDRFLRGYVKTSVSHVSILALNQQGLVNLNRLVTLSHLKYFHWTPRIPRERIEEYREGLLIGSACEDGEIFRAFLEGKDDATLKRLASFYDYLEVQPVENYASCLRQGKAADPKEVEDIIRGIIALGEQTGRPVVATGNAHCLDPEDCVFREVLRHSQHDEDYRCLPPLYLRTTQEMLDAFTGLLGPGKAREIVIENPGKILGRLEDISLFPRHPEGKTTFSPHWEGAEGQIEAAAYTGARSLYGDPLPQVVEERLAKELKSIIGYGYATLYSIAGKLVEKTVSDGYSVGSRGSVGSSLVATLCGITEVNPLPPHYRCVACRTAFFDVPRGYPVGPDLPDRDCPGCGKPMVRDGYDIPFEVFLGFNGDKVPDIDLNFPGVYQPRAHAYAEELFGTGYVYRAGTILLLQDKTALALARKYAQDSGRDMGEAEILRLAQGLVGVKRTTGQHPGGLVVLPREYEINQFTAVQYPADGSDSSVVTTHFDFSSMHDILVKLDILGHDDPTMIHRLGQLTGVDYRKIPLNDEKVLSLFSSPAALGLDESSGFGTGTLAIPEFGTSFVRQILADTRPTTIDELIRIAGLSHGTDVWLGNAKTLISSGTASLRECICTRDDIMNYLLGMGLQAKTAFDIMESVRKGSGLNQAMEDAMRKNGVPQWYIDSCNKIGYMFPKAHAVAYVIMALRVAWYKVHHPLAFYAAYFSVRGGAFDALTMVRPEAYIRSRMQELAAGDRDLSGREKDEAAILEVVLEMLLRGFSFLPPDLYASDAGEFRIENHALRVPLSSLSGFGDGAAQSVVEARKEPFLSVEDLKKRSRISSACVELLREAGALEGLSHTNQLDFFSLI